MKFDELDPRWRNLADVVSKMSRMKYDIDAAVNQPAQLAGEVRSLSIHGSSYGNQESQARAVALANSFKSSAEAAAREIGEAERDKLLVQYAAEIDGLRAVLPGYAAEAAIYLGIVARGIVE